MILYQPGSPVHFIYMTLLSSWQSSWLTLQAQDDEAEEVKHQHDNPFKAAQRTTKGEEVEAATETNAIQSAV